MNKLTPTVERVRQCTLRERVDSFLSGQFNYHDHQDKIYRLESFKADLLHKIYSEGLTDSNLLLGLELNNYLRQINNPESRFERVTYNIGR